jgi:hypothetical protein
MNGCLRPALAAAVLLSGVLLGAGDVRAVMRDADCDDLDIALEPAADFRSIECESGSSNSGGGAGGVGTASIKGEDALSIISVVHDRAGTRTSLRRFDPKDLFADELDIDIEDSWSDMSTVSNGFSVSTFFSRLEDSPDKVPCFAFARYAGHVAHTTGFRHLVGGIYCELVPSDKPVTPARIDQMTGKIKGSMF